MAGSIKSFIYTDDSGRDYVFNQDESNGEAVGNVDFTPSALNPATTVAGLPQGLKPRTVRYQSDDGRVSREIIVSTQALLASLPATIASYYPTTATAVTVVTLVLKSVFNERLRAFTGNDTGLNDGDLT